MNLWISLSTLAGGIGLFLLGMSMMTDGLKLAAGPALERILRGATRTRAHALGSGMLVTALVQSSSAVTVTTIGFVNAGLLTLAPALWVLFGANVGTTMTGWIVALVGLKFKIEVLALPLVGVGALLSLTGQGRRRAIGTALAGFGLLFIGISTLQSAFFGLAERISLPQGEGLLALLAQVGVGALMTVLMQSSSASMTIALTAAQGGMLGAEGAAAVVIGANLGTTVTAMLAAIGATPNARRAAAAHVIFNVLTGAVALLLLSSLTGAIGAGREALGLPPEPAASLALFHTVFNVLGVLLIWPLADRLADWLGTLFRAQEEDAARPRYLDDNTLQVQELAVDALQREIARIGASARRMARASLSGADTVRLRADQAIATSLGNAVDSFVERMNRTAMSAEASARLAALLRVERYLETAVEQAGVAAGLLAAPSGQGSRPGAGQDMAVATALESFRIAGESMLDACESAPQGESAPVWPALETVEQEYQGLKRALLEAGAAGRMTIAAMERALRRGSAWRRMLQQLAKACGGGARAAGVARGAGDEEPGA